MKNIKALLMIVSTMSLFALSACDNKSEPASESKAITIEKEVVAESETETELETEQEAEMLPALLVSYQGEKLDLSTMDLMDWTLLAQKMKMTPFDVDMSEKIEPYGKVYFWGGVDMYNPWNEEISYHEARFSEITLKSGNVSANLDELPETFCFLDGRVNKNSTQEEWVTTLKEVGFEIEERENNSRHIYAALRKDNGQVVKIDMDFWKNSLSELKLTMSNFYE